MPPPPRSWTSRWSARRRREGARAQPRTGSGTTARRDRGCRHAAAPRRAASPGGAAPDRPPGIEAVAGPVLVRNWRANFLTRMQEWDYFLAIAAISGCRVYTGARWSPRGRSGCTERSGPRVGGWPDAIGEDIMVTWRLMSRRQAGVLRANGGRVHRRARRSSALHAPAARWARGMIEGVRAVPPWRQPRVLMRLMAGIDLHNPVAGHRLALIWLPGLVLWRCWDPR